MLAQLPGLSQVATREAAQDALFELEYELSALDDPGPAARYALVQCFVLLSFEYDGHGVFLGMESEARKSASRQLWKQFDHQLDSDMLVSFVERLGLQNLFLESDYVGAWALRFPLFHGAFRPYMWRLRADAMRSQGRWNDVLAFVRQGVAAAHRMPGDEATIRNPALVTLHGYKSTVLLGLGLVDQAAREIELGFALVEPGSWFHLMLLSKRADLYLRQERYAEVQADLVPILKEWPSSTRDELALLILRGHLAFSQSELCRDDPALALRTINEFNFLIEHAEFGVRLTSKLCIELCDMYMRNSDVENARRILIQARELLGPMLKAQAAQSPLFEHALVAAYEAQILLATDASDAQLQRSQVLLDRAFQEFLAQWDNAPASRSGGIGFLEPGGRRFLLSTMIRLRMKCSPGKSGMFAALELIFAVQSRSSLAARVGMVESSVERVRELLLGERQGMLIYLPSRDVTHVFALDDEQLQHAELKPWHELSKDLQRHMNLLRRGRVAAGTLSQLIPVDLEEQTQRWKNWTIVGGDFLSNLPFETLQLPDGRLLGQAVAVDSLGGVSLGLGLEVRVSARVAEPPDPRLTLFATLGLNVDAVEEQTGQKLAPDRILRDDLQRLQSAYAGKVDGRIGMSCTREALIGLGPGLVRSPVVQFFVHGLYLPDRERGAVLALSASEDGAEVLFDCDDVEQYLRLSGLVVLSACGTSRGPSRLGDQGVSHLGGAFLAAGANCVILSGNDIPYGIAIAMSEALHAGLVAGLVPSEALRAARAKLAPGSSLVDQLHMARVQAIGLGHRPVFQPAEAD